jgi:O-6-methylguanine DNA methyltransferase
MIYLDYFHSPIGIIEIICSKESVLSVQFVEETKDKEIKETCHLLENCMLQLKEYFQGDRKTFDLPLEINGTNFQINVLKQVQNVTFGETKSYKEIALAIGNEKAMRAVGNANNKNKILIMIPCHRIIGADGKLVGYAGELWRKEWLLKHEKQ